MKTHSSAFDGLLSLIPAKYYYDDATQDQWQQKKKSKAQAANDKRSKLDPENTTSADTYNNGGATAKDVMENRAKTAKPVTIPGEKRTHEQTSDEPEHTNNGSNDDKKSSKKEEEPAAKKAKTQKKELSEEEKQEKERRRAELKEKLANKINMLREKRRAPGTKMAAGPAKLREQMLAERKRKQELKKQEKLRKKKEEQEGKNGAEDEEQEAENEPENEDILFGNIEFKDGSRVTSDLLKLRKGIAQKKKKGPQNKDIKAHLTILENKKKKLEAMSPEERAEVMEKEKWSRVMNQAEGVKVKDDEKLLRKSLKRKEKQKLRAELEWKERKQTVKDTIAAREKRRDENLKARKEQKGKKGKQPRLRKFSGVVKKGKDKKRAGFEGLAKLKGKK